MQLHCFDFKAMGSPCELRLYAEKFDQAESAAHQARSSIATLEQRYSRYRPDSLTTRINQAAGAEPIEVDAETAALLDYADQAWHQSEGLFDITSGVLRQAWDFHAGQPPEASRLQLLLQRVGWDRVEWQSPCIRLPSQGMEIDFGGYVKEYAADVAARVCREAGIQHGLVDLGGDLQVIGPHPDGSPWRAGIQHPRQLDRAAAVIDVLAGGLASSGDYERFMEIDGRRYCHILNPRTGWPVEGLASVSVLAEQTLVAGTLSTIAMLKGHEGSQWLQQQGLPYLCIEADGSTHGTVATTAATA